VVERGALAGGAVDIGDAINAGGRAGSADEVAVQGAAHVPRVSQGRHVGRLVSALRSFPVFLQEAI